MKKLVAIMLTLLLFIPTFVFAKEFQADDITIELDDDKMIVLTRDNIKNNDEMEEMGITYDYMINFFISNNAYLDAYVIDKNSSQYEIFIMAKNVNVNTNLNRTSDSNVKDFAEGVVSKINNKNYNIVDINDYKYVNIQYTDNGVYLMDYVTVMNGKTYTIKFQKTTEIDNMDELEFEKIMRSIKFKYIQSYDKQNDSVSNSLTKFLVAIIAGGVGGTASVIKKKRNKNKEKINDNSQVNNNTKN